MASLIKNQIIKGLSKFVKNLSSNQINLSTLKGEGELSSIDLDEQALEDVIELPTWLKIQKATCGRVFIKIPWTSLKTLPIHLQLDDVNIEIETCEQLRDLQRQTDSTNNNDPLIGKYGFINRVIDGISLTITSLTLTVKAQGFKASIFFPTIEIYSISPRGERVDTLKLTRLRNQAKDHILLFKEISWANARIEASSHDTTMVAAAIRLIANACRIRISMKKNLEDSSMVTSRVMLHFDDLLSVVNDAQLKSALNTYKEISQLMKRASEQRKRKAGDKLTKLEEQQQRSSFQPRAPTTGNNDPLNPVGSFNNPVQSKDPFERYDILETSLHFNIKRLDLHIIADSDILSDRLAESGALQMTIANISIDHYPYHQYGSSKQHWVKYSEMQSSNRDEWAYRLREDWNEQLKLATSKVSADEMSTKLEKALDTNKIRLFESCTVVNIDDLVFYPVSLNNTTNNSKEQKRRRPLIKSDRTQYQLPEHLGVINVQHTEYYYPLPYSFPVPSSDLHVQIMPIVMRVDFATLSWLDAFITSISMTIDNSGVLKMNRSSSSSPEHVSIKLEAMLPRIVVSSDMFSNAYQLEEAKHEQQPLPDLLERKDIPNQEQMELLELNISKVVLTNCRADLTSDQKKLDQHRKLFQESSFFQENQFPFSTNSTTIQRISSLFEKDPQESYLYKNPLNQSTSQLSEPESMDTALHQYYTMTTDSLKKSSKYDVWQLNAENIYLDFTPTSPSPSNRAAKQNMTDTLSFIAWAVIDEKIRDSRTFSWLNILGVVENSSMLKLSQKQYTFLMHLVDELGLFLDVLERNKVQSRLIRKQIDEKSSSSATDLKITACLTCPNTFTLAVIDGLPDVKFDPLTSSLPASLPEAELEPTMRDTSDLNIVVDLVATVAPIVASTAKVEPSSPLIQVIDESNGNLNKGFQLLAQKKTKTEELIQRGLDIASKTSRGSSQSLSAMNDNSDDLSQWDQMSEDLDTDLDLISLSTDLDQQQKAARIDLDDDSLSLSEKTPSTMESVNGVFVKLNGIQVCVTDEDTENDASGSIYVALNVKKLRIDEFYSMKFDSLRPKLFENERPDPLNDENVPPVNVRIDFPKGSDQPPPTVTLKIADRMISSATHAIDVILETLEEIHTNEEKNLRRSRPKKFVPIDVYLNNVCLSLDKAHEFPTTDAVVDVKPPVRIQIEQMHLLRQIDGQVNIQTINGNESSPKLPKPVDRSNNDEKEKLRQMTLENEKLRDELKAHKNEIVILRGERDSLMKTISKLDIELTEAEHQRSGEQKQQSTKK